MTNHIDTIYRKLCEAEKMGLPKPSVMLVENKVWHEIKQELWGANIADSARGIATVVYDNVTGREKISLFGVRILRSMDVEGGIEYWYKQDQRGVEW